MSKRKYTKGDRIHSLDELSNQTFVIFDNECYRKTYHCGWICSMQIMVVKKMIDSGYLYYALPIQKEGESKYGSRRT